jgi:putative transposase
VVGYDKIWDMRNVEIVEGEIYHIFNRGTEKRKIFLNNNDYGRFLVNMILFNTASSHLTNISRYSVSDAGLLIPDDPLVKIHAFVLLPNHFHFILEQVAENGIARFMHRLEMGYSQYFNRLNGRSGVLFQGAYKAVLVDTDAYFSYLPIYIHLNPLDLSPVNTNWKELGAKNKKEALSFLKKYPWSSLRSYLDLESQPFVEKGLLSENYKKPADWERELMDWLPEEDFGDTKLEP